MITANNSLRILLLQCVVYSSGFLYSQLDTLVINRIDSTISQSKDSIKIVRKNSIFLEIAGNGVLYSVNYDRLFNLSDKFKLSARIGVHYTNKFPLQFYRTVCIPIELSGLYCFYKNKHFVELGTGLSYLNSNDRVTQHAENIIIFAMRLGYRFQKPEGGLFVKVGFVPLYDWIVKNPDLAVPHHSWLFSGGLGIGYTL